jgi:hypothetical protein
MSLFEYWNETSPPVHELFAAFVGFKPQEKSSDIDLNVLAQVPGLQGAIRPYSSVPPEVRKAFEQIKNGKKPNA